MKHQLVDEIECGKTTCASEPKKFCKYIASQHFGQISVCTRFLTDYQFTRLYDNGNGWVQRCPECLEKFKGV